MKKLAILVIMSLTCMAVIPCSHERNTSVTPTDGETWSYLSGENMRLGYARSSNRDTFKMDSISKVVPIYRIKDDVRGQFLDRFLDTLSRMNAINLVAMLPVKEFYQPYKGKKRDYTLIYPPAMVTLYFTSKVKGAFITSSGRRFVLTDTASQWISRWGLEKTEGTITIGCRTADVFYPDVPSYSALLFTTDDGKVNPVKILTDGYRIQTGHSYKKKHWFNWIDSFYSDHSLPPGCDYHTQIHDGYDELSIHP